MSTPPDWHDLIGAIYDAAMDDALWTPAMGRIMAQVGASQSALFSPVVDPATNLPVLLNRHTQEGTWELYMSYYGKIDPVVLRASAQGLFKTGTIAQSESLVPRRELRRSEYYDFLKPQDIEVMLNAVISDGSQAEKVPPMVLSLYRPTNAETFCPADEQLIRQLLPHLQRSLRIRWQMHRCHEAGSLREAALDHLAQAVALLDDTGRVLFANRRAEAIFRDGGGPTVVNQRLTVRDAQGAARLKEALRHAVLGVGDSVRLENPAQQRQWVATFSPLRVPGLRAPAATRILLLIAEPEQTATEGIPAFAKLYGLTPAEARVLQHLVDQQSTQDIAAALSISIKTLRSHLAKLFAKTQTANQRDLVRFFLAHPAVSRQHAG